MLDSADGNRFAAFLAIPEEELGAGVVILPDVRGLYRFYEELALRFAERGIVALAFDYFGRTAGLEKRPNDWDYMPLVQQLTMEQVQADVARPLRTSARWAPTRSSPSASVTAAAARGRQPRGDTDSQALSVSTGGLAG